MYFCWLFCLAWPGGGRGGGESVVVCIYHLDHFILFCIISACVYIYIRAMVGSTGIAGTQHMVGGWN